MSDEPEEKCAECESVIGDRYWNGPLPWLFCSRACIESYYGKDGPIDDAKPGAGEEGR